MRDDGGGGSAGWTDGMDAVFWLETDCRPSFSITASFESREAV